MPTADGSAARGLGAGGSIGEQRGQRGAAAQVARWEATGVEHTEVMEQDHRTWWVRVRSAALLALLLFCIGAAVATVLGLVGFAVATLFDHALG
jgi:hypothetical protein